MSIELRIPAVGESITEVEVGEWLKNVGDPVGTDETIVMIETDKVTAEILAPKPGKVTQIIKKEGEAATVGEVIGYMDTAEQAEVSSPTPAAPEPAAKPPAPQVTTVMPAAQRELAARGIEANDVNPTGPGGRLLKEDVVRHVPQEVPAPTPAPTPAPVAAKPAPTPAPVAAKPAPTPAPIQPPVVSNEGRIDEAVTMTPLRRKVAQRLVEAQQNAALLTTFNEVDMSEVMKTRKIYQESFIKKNDIKLGFMSFFIKATIDALKEIPQINAELKGQEIIYKNYFDIGVAVGGGKGLVVPVIRNAEKLSFSEIELTIRDFGTRAKAGKLKLEELQGGTFTISNGGVYGSLLSTPIVNPPQSGILGLHGIKERPMAIHGEVVIRPMMYIALTYDHRIVDGREAVTFLNRIKDCIEAPERMLLEI